MKSLAPYLIGFGLLVAAAWFLGGRDPITDAVVDARSETSTGPVNMNVMSDAFALLFHITTAGIIATALGWAVLNAGKLGKIYRHWWSAKLTRRWQPGPNAYFRQKAPSAPKLTREDLMLMSLMNQGRGGALARLPRVQKMDQEAEDEINIDF